MAQDRVVDVNQVLSGTEPTFKNSTIDPKEYRTVLMLALNWYSREKTWEDSLKYFMTHFKNEPISSGINPKVVANVGYICRMISRGFPASDKLNKLINSTLVKAKAATIYLKEQEKIKAEEAKKEEKLVYKVPGLIDDPKVSAFLNDYDGHIDDIIMGKTKSINLHSTFLSKQQKQMIKTYVERTITGIEGLTQEEKGFSNATEKTLRTFVAKILNELGAAPVRAPRKKKVIPIEKMIEKLQYSKKSEIKPEKIIGANILIAYDEKSRKIRVYHSTDGFGVKGTTLLNVDDDKSYSKTLRKPDEQLVKIKGLPKMSLLKEVEAIRATPGKLNGRLNEDVILLKVF